MTVDINTGQKEDLVVIDHLDFEHEPPCEWTGRKTQLTCDEPADFSMVLSCCGKILLHCEDHFLRIANLLKRGEEQGVYFSHNVAIGGCGNRLSILSFERIR